MPNLRESTTAVVARGEWFRDGDATEPYEAGWAAETVVFVLGMDEGSGGAFSIQISPDGMNWVNEGSEITLPSKGEVAFARVGHFGNWIRVIATAISDGGQRRCHVTINCKG